MELIRDDPIIEGIQANGTEYPRSLREHYMALLKHRFPDFSAVCDGEDENGEDTC